MKFKKRLFAALLAITVLCGGCSVGNTGSSEPQVTTAIPLAEHGGSAPTGFTDVPSGAWYAEAAE